jgi:hypothetical protein
VLTLAESSAGRPWGKLDLASRMYLSPAQLCDLLGVGAAGQVPLATLLFPRMRADRDGLELRDLPPDEALPLLESGRFADGGRSPRFFAADPASGDDAPAPSPARLRMLVQRVRCAEVSLGTNAYAEGSAAFVASVS